MEIDSWDFDAFWRRAENRAKEESRWMWPPEEQEKRDRWVEKRTRQLFMEMTTP